MRLVSRLMPHLVLVRWLRLMFRTEPAMVLHRWCVKIRTVADAVDVWRR